MGTRKEGESAILPCAVLQGKPESKRSRGGGVLVLYQWRGSEKKEERWAAHKKGTVR